jgi:arsenite/tail-anchored protein-transporting ATPase
VLLISTDPAHNLSDAFSQKFGKEPTAVKGFDNLYAMEIDPSATMEDLAKATSERQAAVAGGSLERTSGTKDAELDETGGLGSLFQSGLMTELTSSIPGIDEAMGFAHIMKLVKSLEFSVIVFDTAPTGHTLRFLNFPRVMEKALGKLVDMTGKFGGMMQQFSGLMGMSLNHEDAFGKLSEMKRTVEEVHRQFTDPEKTTFVCVCIAEFLSLYETERMIQELQSFHIDTHVMRRASLLSFSSIFGSRMWL